MKREAAAKNDTMTKYEFNWRGKGMIMQIGKNRKQQFYIKNYKKYRNQRLGRGE